MIRPSLILLCGIPGSGKTHYATKIVQDRYNTVHLSSDLIRKELWGDEAIQGDNNEVFSLMQKRTVEALNDCKSVVYDATNITRKDRACIISQCPKFVNIECHIVWAPIKTCIERDLDRDRTVGKDVIDKMLKRFQAPYFDEGIHSFCLVCPENFDDCEYEHFLLNAIKIPHDNPHHSLDIFDHCCASRDYALQNRYGWTLSLAAAYHDIGKSYVKAFIDSKGNPCNNAHYYQHQCVGSWQYYGIGSGNPCIEETIEIAWLISTHMDPFLNTKYWRNLPAFLKKDVDLLHEADVNAH